MDHLDEAEAIATFIKKSGDLALYETTLNLRAGLLRLREENLALKDKVRELEGMLKTHKNVLWEAPYYWLKTENTKDGPYCATCYDTKKLLVHLHGRKGVWTCHACKSSVTDSTFVRPASPNVRRGSNWSTDY